MNKLELRHLASYLPYSVKVMSQQGTVFLMDTYSSMGGNCERRTIDVVITNCFKLILHPLSDLIKPCLPEGKIPILELAKIAFKKPDYIAWMEDGNCLVGYKSKSPSYLFSWSKSHCSFSVMDLFYSGSKWRANKDTFCSNQLSLFEWLFEHHFDVKNLIEQNLAVDINTLQK